MLASTQTNTPSVIQVRTQDVLPTSIESLVISAFHQFETELNNGALVTIDKATSRVRILPIRQG
ncbi:MAG: hypothetical protein QNJ36_00135 [Calothrix sp. MO_167.B42]|nr:hypothetical protein [Calothrix sp. MO_167.B42]